MLLEVRGVSKRFGGLVAVRDVDLVVAPGEIVGIIGPNGAGKTTLFNILTGFIRPDAGSVRFAGREMVGRPPHAACAAGMARTFQIVKPFPRLTVRENALVGAYAVTASRAKALALADEALTRAGLGAHAERQAAELPIGLQKRLELARALATNPRLLFLDEVMAGLGASDVDEITTLLPRLRGEGLTICLIEHVLRAAMRLADRIVVMHEGRVLVEGTPAAVSRDPRVIAAYLGEEYGAA